MCAKSNTIRVCPKTDHAVSTYNMSVWKLTKGSLFSSNTKHLYIKYNILIYMADDRISMPVSSAGLTRYFDEYKSKIQFQPIQVIILSVLVILITIALHVFGKGLL